MKKLFVAFAAIVIAGLHSCGPKCQKCYTEALGVESAKIEVCGEELKMAKENPMLKCE